MALPGAAGWGAPGGDGCSAPVPNAPLLDPVDGTGAAVDVLAGAVDEDPVVPGIM